MSQTTFRDCRVHFYAFYRQLSRNSCIPAAGGAGGEGGNKAWDRETMFSQLAKQSARQRF